MTTDQKPKDDKPLMADVYAAAVRAWADECPAPTEPASSTWTPRVGRWYETGEPLTDAIAKANHEDGHDMEFDPPSGMSSVTRWTCKNPKCGRAILRTPGGPIYGSAAEKKCSERWP